jgi:ribosomal protein S17
MGSKIFALFGFSALLLAGVAFAGDENKRSDDKNRPAAQYSSERDEGAIGRIKTLETGKKVEIDVRDGMDREFDLTEHDTHVSLAPGLQVGDTVKVTETESDGRKTVTIARYEGSAMAGDETARAGDRETDTEVAIGKVEEYEAGKEIEIDVENAFFDREYELNERDTQVSVEPGIQVGDAVKVTETEADGRKTVTIAKLGSGAMSANGAAAGADADVESKVGKIKKYQAGKHIEIDMDNAMDREFDLTDRDLRASVAPGLSVGDSVKITEHEQNGVKYVTIERSDSSAQTANGHAGENGNRPHQK